MKFRTWLESGMLEVTPQEVSEAQSMWQQCFEMLDMFNNNMNYALASYCAHMVEGDSPDNIGKQLGIALVHAEHYKKMAAPVDRNKVFEYVKKLSPQGQAIAQAALQAYSMYEMRPFTKGTIGKLG